MAKSKKDPQSRHWFFTIGADTMGQAEIESCLSDASFYIGQEEIGEKSDFRHFQVFASWDSPKRASTLRRTFGVGPGRAVHLERKHAGSTPHQAALYCSKEETRAPGAEVFQKGEMPAPSAQGRRTDVERYHSLIMSGWSVDDVLLVYPAAARMVNGLRAMASARDRELSKSMRDVRAAYIWGKAGCGKTTAVYETFGDSLFRVVSYGTGAFDNYRGERCIFLDDYTGQLDVTLLLALGDRFPLEIPARYANKFAQHTRLIVASNMPWSQVHWEATGEVRAALGRRFQLRQEVTAENVDAVVKEFAEGRGPEMQGVLDTFGLS